MDNSHLLLAHIQYTSAGIEHRRPSTRTWPYLLIIGLAAGLMLGLVLQ